MSAMTGPSTAMKSWNDCACNGSTPISRAVNVNEVAKAFISVSFDVDNEFHTGLEVLRNVAVHHPAPWVREFKEDVCR